MYKRLLVLIFTFSLFGYNISPLYSVSMQVYEYGVKHSKKKSQNTIMAGIYVYDISTRENFFYIHDVIKNLVQILKTMELKNGEDYFYSPDYFIFVAKTSEEAKKISEELLLTKRQIESLDIKSVNHSIKNPSEVIQKQIGKYLIPLDTKLNLNNSYEAQEFGLYADTRGKIEFASQNLENFLKQKENLHDEKKSISKLLKKYKNFSELYNELSQMEKAISEMISNPLKPVAFKSLMIDVARDGKIPVLTPTEGTTHFPNRKLSYRQLERRIKNYPEDDVSIKQIKRYLMLLNILFLNRHQLPELTKLTPDPYNQIVVLEIINMKEIVSTENNSYMKNKSTLVQGSYKLLHFVDLFGLFGVNLINKNGKSAIINFAKNSEIADLKNLKNSEAMIRSAIKDSENEIADNKQILKENRYHVTLKNVSTSKIIAFNNLALNLGYSAAELNIAKLPDEKNLEVQPETEKIPKSNDPFYDIYQTDLPIRLRHNLLLREVRMNNEEISDSSFLAKYKLEVNHNIYITKDGDVYLVGKDTKVISKKKRKGKR